MKLYTNRAVELLAEQYQKKGGTVSIVEEGSLATFGLALFHGEGLKTAVVREKQLNEWSSGSVVRFFNKLPAKYAGLIA